MRLSPKIYCILCVLRLGPGRFGLGRRNLRPPQTARLPVPLVLTGGTVVDVTDWGHSARDLQDAVVIVRDGQHHRRGPGRTITIPKGARVIDCTGKFIIPGLVDGYAGMNSQGQANANLYMGVTTVVARNDHATASSTTPPIRARISTDRLGRRNRRLELAGQPAGVDWQAQEGHASRRAQP